MVEISMMKFWEYNNVLYREILRIDEWVWLIEFDSHKLPIRVFHSLLEKESQVPSGMYKERSMSDLQKSKIDFRKKIIAPLIDDDECIVNRNTRNEMVRQIAYKNSLSCKTILRWYISYLSKGDIGLLRISESNKKEPRKKKNEFEQLVMKSINQHFYSFKRLSLQATYELFLQENYVDKTSGQLSKQYPTFGQFRYAYQKLKNPTNSIISRNGLSEWQRNYRPLLGKSEDDVKYAGVYQMDSTQLDIILVSSYTRKPIHRPTLYLAIDTFTSLITGFHLTFTPNQESVLACLANTATNKVEFCEKYGVCINEEQWNNTGLPSCIVTDRGVDFIGSNVKEICSMFGIECVSLPPYRPDLKGKVERAIGLIQERFKATLVNAGAVVENPYIDYKKSACLDYQEFMKVLIECIIYYNGCRVIDVPNSLLVDIEDIKPTPCGLWKYLKEKKRLKTINVNEDDLYLMCLPKDTASITRFGVCYKNVYYSTDLIDLSQRYMTAGIKGSEKVKIAYDPNNIKTIYMINDGVYIELTALQRFSSFKDMSFFEFELLLNSKKRIQKEYTKSQIQGALECNTKIQEIAKEGIEKSFGIDLQAKELTVKQMKLNRKIEDGENND